MTDDDTGTKLWAEIHTTLRGIKHATDSWMAKERKTLERIAKSAVIPADIRLKGQATAANAVAVVPVAAPVGSPDQGHVWLLRNVCIGRGEAALATGVSGVAYIVVRPTPPGGIAPSATSLDWEGVKDSMTLSALGPPRQYSGRQIVVKPEEYLYVIVTGATNGQVVYAQIDVEDVQESAARQSFDI